MKDKTIHDRSAMYTSNGGNSIYELFYGHPRNAGEPLSLLEAIVLQKQNREVDRYQPGGLFAKPMRPQTQAQAPAYGNFAPPSSGPMSDSRLYTPTLDPEVRIPIEPPKVGDRGIAQDAKNFRPIEDTIPAKIPAFGTLKPPGETAAPPDTDIDFYDRIPLADELDDTPAGRGRTVTARGRQLGKVLLDSRMR